jgi:hypothetical protein
VSFAVQVMTYRKYQLILKMYGRDARSLWPAHSYPISFLGITTPDLVLQIAILILHILNGLITLRELACRSAFIIRTLTVSKQDISEIYHLIFLCVLSLALNRPGLLAKTVPTYASSNALIRLLVINMGTKQVTEVV